MEAQAVDQVVAELPRGLCPGAPVPASSKAPSAAGRARTSPTATRRSGSAPGEFVRPLTVKVGLTDGLKTEIAAGGDLIERSQVVVGQAEAGEGEGEMASAGQAGTASPFLPDLKKGKAKR